MDGEVVLPAEARVHGHDEHELDEVEHVGDGTDGCRRVQRHARGGTQVAHTAQRAMEVRGRLGVDDEQAAPCLHPALEHPVRVLHHEVSLERHRRVRAAGGDHVGPHRQVRHEGAVHDVPLDSVDTGRLERSDLLAETGEVGRQNRGRDRKRSVRAGSVGHGRKLGFEGRCP